MAEDTSSPGQDETNFIENARRLRESRGWSQTELARRMAELGWENYSQMTVSRTEKGERPLRLGEARALARVLEKSLDAMLRPPAGQAVKEEAVRLASRITGAYHDTSEAAWRLLGYRGALEDLAGRAKREGLEDAAAMAESLLKDAAGKTPEDAIEEGRHHYDNHGPDFGPPREEEGK